MKQMQQSSDEVLWQGPAHETKKSASLVVILFDIIIVFSTSNM